ncbi:type IV toxin-antitoxin system AbiEi family antitoxin domain-containing protein [Aestuariivirga sp.]|uniref:type IV toxin-antitoxin system AbiEi family antitoxin domain-containing protein n=1 Tax=Aestuariivirga sp. TaxID=2650926 RepID=UPI0035941176
MPCRNRQKSAIATGIAPKRYASPEPSLRTRAIALARERGIVRTRDLTDIGIPRCYLTRMCNEGLLTKVSNGLYRATEREAA